MSVITEEAAPLTLSALRAQVVELAIETGIRDYSILAERVILRLTDQERDALLRLLVSGEVATVLSRSATVTSTRPVSESEDPVVPQGQTEQEKARAGQRAADVRAAWTKLLADRVVLSDGTSKALGDCTRGDLEAAAGRARERAQAATETARRLEHYARLLGRAKVNRFRELPADVLAAEFARVA